MHIPAFPDKNPIPFLVFLFLLPTLAVSEEQLTGIWSAKDRTKGGLGSQWTFFSNGELSFTFGALVDFKYEFTNTHISMQVANPGSKDEKPQKEKYTISEGKLTVTNEDTHESKVMDWAGVPVKTSHPLIGDWTYKHYVGKDALMRYTSHGLAQLSVPFMVENGTYLIEGDNLTVKFRDGEPDRYTYKRTNKRLMLESVKSGKKMELELLEY